MLLDENEQKELKERSQKFLKTKRIKKKFQPSADIAMGDDMNEDDDLV